MARAASWVATPSPTCCSTATQWWRCLALTCLTRPSETQRPAQAAPRTSFAEMSTWTRKSWQKVRALAHRCMTGMSDSLILSALHSPFGKRRFLFTRWFWLAGMAGCNVLIHCAAKVAMWGPFADFQKVRRAIHCTEGNHRHAHGLPALAVDRPSIDDPGLRLRRLRCCPNRSQWKGRRTCWRPRNRPRSAGSCTSAPRPSWCTAPSRSSRPTRQRPTPLPPFYAPYTESKILSERAVLVSCPDS